jgi:hypothetical protein
VSAGRRPKSCGPSGPRADREGHGHFKTRSISTCPVGFRRTASCTCPLVVAAAARKRLSRSLGIEVGTSVHQLGGADRPSAFILQLRRRRGDVTTGGGGSGPQPAGLQGARPRPFRIHSVESLGPAGSRVCQHSVRLERRPCATPEGLWKATVQVRPCIALEGDVEPSWSLAGAPGSLIDQSCHLLSR